LKLKSTNTKWINFTFVLENKNSFWYNFNTILTQFFIKNNL
jgi:hypothetical protein